MTAGAGDFPFRLGLDLGSSGVRSAVIGRDGVPVSQARVAYPPAPPGPGKAMAWWRAAHACISAQVKAMAAARLDPFGIGHIAVDGTSGTVVLTDAAWRPVTRPLYYNDQVFGPEADQIAALAPLPHITRGANSALARVLRLRAEAGAGGGAGGGAAKAGAAAREPVHLMHQADFVTAQLRDAGGISDENNALKTGFDPETGRWPGWFDALGLHPPFLPQVVPAGQALGRVHARVAHGLGLSPDLTVHAGTTDSIAAFLAAAGPLGPGGALPGRAVTSLGSTLAVKMLSDRRVDAPEMGLYAHPMGRYWLIGGASNTGGAVLAHYFSPARIKELCARIDPALATQLDYYPLPARGERFPVNDPNFAPRLSPRPKDDAAFLHGLLEGIARIESQCYRAITRKGGPRLRHLTTAGGGSANPVWTAIRARVLGVTPTPARNAEAAVGAALLCPVPGVPLD